MALGYATLACGAAPDLPMGAPQPGSTGADSVSAAGGSMDGVGSQEGEPDTSGSVSESIRVAGLSGAGGNEAGGAGGAGSDMAGSDMEGSDMEGSDMEGSDMEGSDELAGAGAMPASAGSDALGDDRAYAGCTATRTNGCDYIYVAMQDPATSLCVQLSMNNCPVYNRPGLPVDLPFGWRLASGVARQGAVECAPDQFYAGSVPALSASGSITWDKDAPAPAEFVIDMALQLSARDGVPSEIAIVSSALSDALGECE